MGNNITRKQALKSIDQFHNEVSEIILEEMKKEMNSEVLNSIKAVGKNPYKIIEHCRNHNPNQKNNIKKIMLKHAKDYIKEDNMESVVDKFINGDFVSTAADVYAPKDLPQGYDYDHLYSDRIRDNKMVPKCVEDGTKTKLVNSIFNNNIWETMCIKDSKIMLALEENQNGELTTIITQVFPLEDVAVSGNSPQDGDHN